MSFLYSNWKIEIDDEGITYQTLLKKKKRISYSNVSKVLKDEYGNLILYEDESTWTKDKEYIRYNRFCGGDNEILLWIGFVLYCCYNFYAEYLIKRKFKEQSLHVIVFFGNQRKSGFRMLNT